MMQCSVASAVDQEEDHCKQGPIVSATGTPKTDEVLQLVAYLMSRDKYKNNYNTMHINHI